MFIENKYQKHYNMLIARSITRILPNKTYIERHHILPKSLGGSNDKSNIANLTAREHFIAHLLLTKFTTGNAKQKMFFAMNRIMNGPNNCSKSSRIYQYLRENYSKTLSDSSPLREWNKRRRGKTYEETYGIQKAINLRESRSRSNSNRTVTDITKSKISYTKTGVPNEKLKGVPKSEASRLNMSIARRAHFEKSSSNHIWFHPAHGEFTGTIYDLIENFPEHKIRPGEINKVVNSNYHSHRNWSLKKHIS